jgi:hypothetical protein
LEDARARLAQALEGIDAETLRDSMALRDSVKAQVDDVLDVFKLNTSLFN